MNGIKLSELQAAYAQGILDSLELESCAILIDGANVLSFSNLDYENMFIDALRDEIAYDKSCGVKTAGAALLRRLKA